MLAQNRRDMDGAQYRIYRRLERRRHFPAHFAAENKRKNGGFVYGAFYKRTAKKGFASVDPDFFGTVCRYLDLSNIFVSRDFRRSGIGKRLFEKIKRVGKNTAAPTGCTFLHIRQSKVKSFYSAMGCTEAQEYNMALVQKEPCDCQLECTL